MATLHGRKEANRLDDAHGHPRWKVFLRNLLYTDPQSHRTPRAAVIFRRSSVAPMASRIRQFQVRVVQDGTGQIAPRRFMRACDCAAEIGIL